VQEIQQHIKNNAMLYKIEKEKLMFSCQAARFEMLLAKKKTDLKIPKPA
jgi:hypothetical protein